MYESSSEVEVDFKRTTTNDLNDVEKFDFDLEKIETSDFVLVKSASKKTLSHYVGRVEKQIGEEYEIKFLRKKSGGFVYPNMKQDILLKLPVPTKTGGTGRLFSIIFFETDFSSYENLC